jgi:hypothetical protein
VPLLRAGGANKKAFTGSCGPAMKDHALLTAFGADRVGIDDLTPILAARCNVEESRMSVLGASSR